MSQGVTANSWAYDPVARRRVHVRVQEATGLATGRVSNRRQSSAPNRTCSGAAVLVLHSCNGLSAFSCGHSN